MTQGVPERAAAVRPPPEGTPWRVMQLARWSAQYLSEKGVPEPRLDVEHLLADVLGMDRLQLYLHFDRPVTGEELTRFRPLLRERARRKPLQYVLGRSHFRALVLRTDARVLIPRPETEELVEVVLQRVREWGREDLRALDVGTGSGAIALALAQEGPFLRIVATDPSPEALDVARENAEMHGLTDRVEFRVGSLLEPVDGERFDVLVSNPPYVSEREYDELQPEVRSWEPRTALVAGRDGLTVLDRLIERAGTVLHPGGLLALEVGLGQAETISRKVAATGGFEPPVVLQDLAGRERMVLSTWVGV